MPEQLFDRAAEYEAMLNAGIGLSGESQQFFIEGRVMDLKSQLSSAPRRILDFGCGVGTTCGYLGRVFPEAQIVGADLSEAAIAHAREQYGSDRVHFTNLCNLTGSGPFDLCYVNGVFHHVLPDERQRTLQLIREYLVPGSHLAVFENNPWNLGARLVMSRIPFDRDAIPLSSLELRRRLRAAGFEVCQSRFLFYFPKPLATLRVIEPWLVRVPLGAQYCVLARVPTFPGGTGRSHMP